MIKITKFWLCLFGLNTFFCVENASARGRYDLSDKVNSTLSDELQNCETLLTLETRKELKLSEEQLGQLVYDLIHQISESPLEYCEDFKMSQVVEQQPDKTFF